MDLRANGSESGEERKDEERRKHWETVEPRIETPSPLFGLRKVR